MKIKKFLNKLLSSEVDNWNDKSIGFKLGYLLGFICITTLLTLLTSFIVIGSVKLILWFITL